MVFLTCVYCTRILSVQLTIGTNQAEKESVETQRGSTMGDFFYLALDYFIVFLQTFDLIANFVSSGDGFRSNRQCQRILQAQES